MVLSTKGISTMRGYLITWDHGDSEAFGTLFNSTFEDAVDHAFEYRGDATGFTIDEYASTPYKLTGRGRRVKTWRLK